MCPGNALDYPGLMSCCRRRSRPTSLPASDLRPVGFTAFRVIEGQECSGRLALDLEVQLRVRAKTDDPSLIPTPVAMIANDPRPIGGRAEFEIHVRIIREVANTIRVRAVRDRLKDPLCAVWMFFQVENRHALIEKRILECVLRW